MKENDRLNQMFDQARSEIPIVKKDHIDDLIKSGKQVSAKKIKLGKAGRGLFNPLNLIIMISTIAIITSLFFVFNGTPKTSQERHQVPASAGMTEENTKKQKIAKKVVSPAEAGTSTRTTVSSKIELPENTSQSHGVVKPASAKILVEADTITMGQIFELSKEDLTRLGFEFDDNGYYYLNELPDKSIINLWSYFRDDPGASASSVGFGRGGYVNPVIKKKATNKDYYPVCTSSLWGDQLRVLDGMPEDFRKNFEYYNDTLVPVILLCNKLGGEADVDILVWFKVSEQFYIDLGSKIQSLTYQSHLRIRAELEDRRMANIVEYDYSYIDSDFDNAIYLENSILEKLGFELTADSLVYRYGSLKPCLEFWFTSFGRGLESIQNPAVKNDEKDSSKPFLIAVSNLQLKMTMKVIPSAFYQVDSSITGSNWIDICIPVKISESKGQLWEGSTFWFYPNERFFNSLPDSIGIPMAKEYNVNVVPKLRGSELGIAKVVITAAHRTKMDQKTEAEEYVPCEYFPSFCEGLPGLDNLNVYPNPATENINIEVTISREKSIDYRVFDISGRLMIDYLETKDYPEAGIYKQRIDVSSLREGFYLLVLSDEEGAKMTKRIVKN